MIQLLMVPSYLKVDKVCGDEVLHIGNHGPDYIKYVTKALQEVKDAGGSQVDAVHVLNDIRKGLMDGSVKLN